MARRYLPETCCDLYLALLPTFWLPSHLPWTQITPTFSQLNDHRCSGVLGGEWGLSSHWMQFHLPFLFLPSLCCPPPSSLLHKCRGLPLLSCPFFFLSYVFPLTFIDILRDVTPPELLMSSNLLLYFWLLAPQVILVCSEDLMCTCPLSFYCVSF